ncbi:DUF2512 family protein [Effusibacillus consociatus]|uniref:DUF2512 family protein n=1 Tax=Effusibacillus consociatus TaxID=1117041 RepID=A0ABV9Q5B3_9BACL
MNKFLIKFLLNGAVVIPLLIWFSDATLLQSVVMALLLSIIAFLVGDQLVLRLSNNTVATFVDGILAFGFLWLVRSMMGWTLGTGEVLTITVGIVVVEWFFHRQLAGITT